MRVGPFTVIVSVLITGSLIYHMPPSRQIARGCGMGSGHGVLPEVVEEEEAVVVVVVLEERGLMSAFHMSLKCAVSSDSTVQLIVGQPPNKYSVSFSTNSTLSTRASG